jgi:hypothetical protein
MFLCGVRVLRYCSFKAYVCLSEIVAGAVLRDITYHRSPKFSARTLGISADLSGESYDTRAGEIDTFI